MTHGTPSREPNRIARLLSLIRWPADRPVRPEDERAADFLLARHGARAATIAFQRMLSLQVSGNTGEADTWRRIARSLERRIDVAA